MDETMKFRIKPKKEKRWICVTKYGAGRDIFKTEEECRNNYFQLEGETLQFIEIEVEVKG